MNIGFQKAWRGLIALTLTSLFVFGCAVDEHMRQLGSTPTDASASLAVNQTPATPERVRAQVRVHDILKTAAQYGKVDIVFVIDNSASMYTWQAALKDNVKSFMATLAANPEMDAKFGIISTDLNNPTFLGFTSPAYLRDANIASRFSNAVDALFKKGGTAYESAFLNVQIALDAYPGFLRADAKLAVVIITDAPEQSDHYTWLSGPRNAASFVTYLQSKKGSAAALLGYGIFGPQPECTRTDSQWSWQGSEYQKYISAVQGERYLLCQGFGAQLANLSQDLIERTFSARIALPSIPDLDTIEVDEDGVILDSSWYSYDAETQSVVFRRFDFADHDDVLTVSYYPR